MSVTAQKLITAEEFMKMPDPVDGSREELIRGVIVTVPPPKGRHGVCCARVSRLLGNHVDASRLGIVTCNDAGFISERDPDTVRGPDVAYWSKEQAPEVPQGYFLVPPDLAVEVVSPDDHFTRVQGKVGHYLAVGVRLVWVIDPEDRSVSAYHPQRPLRILGERDALTGDEILPGFSCRVVDLLP